MTRRCAVSSIESTATCQWRSCWDGSRNSSVVRSRGCLAAPRARSTSSCARRPKTRGCSNNVRSSRELCRYALEEDHARDTERNAAAEEIAAYVNRCAERLLLLLGERRDPLPTLIGFDGS